MVEWCNGAGQLPVPGRPTISITVGQGLIALAVGAGGGCLDIFTLIYPFSSFSLSLGDGPIETELLSQRAVKPKPINQPNLSSAEHEVLKVSYCDRYLSVVCPSVRMFVYQQFLQTTSPPRAMAQFQNNFTEIFLG